VNGNGSVSETLLKCEGARALAKSLARLPVVAISYFDMRFWFA